MKVSARPADLDAILAWREFYRQEMNCQIVHDSIHARAGWTREYVLHVNGEPAGYGSVAVSGPWQDRPTVYEFFVLPPHRNRAFDLFSALLAESAAEQIEIQSNDALLCVMLHAFAHNIVSESILFHDRLTTAHVLENARLRRALPGDSTEISSGDLDTSAEWLVESGGSIAATGGILFHYNRPYGDIYLKVADRFRCRGIGTYLVQELKRICYEQGSVPAARCRTTNLASRSMLQKAGFVPCGHILTGTVRRE